MAHLRFRGVNDAFYTLVKMFQDGRDNGEADVPNEDRMLPITKKPSRVGDVLQIEEPMLVTFTHPRERVLFNNTRDANCFFHLFESLWMLAGRNDIKPLEYYSSKIADFCSDDGLTANGAYGRRWRYAKDWSDYEHTTMEGSKYVDQLAIIIDQLKRKPESRRVVLQMWNVEDDLLKIDQTKDCCCNLSVLFSIRRETVSGGRNGGAAVWKNCLDMTVTNRSNDLILGLLGANVVHFSFLQEYIATALGIEVGVYNQFSNNLHVYTEANGGFRPEEWLSDPIYGDASVGEPMVAPYDPSNGPDEGVNVSPYLIGSMRGFVEEVKQFIDNPYQCWGGYVLNHVAKPMCEAFRHHKARQYGLAEEALSRVAAEDWRGAGRLWIQKRRKNWESKKGSE